MLVETIVREVESSPLEFEEEVVISEEVAPVESSPLQSEDEVVIPDEVVDVQQEPEFESQTATYNIVSMVEEDSEQVTEELLCFLKHCMHIRGCGVHPEISCKCTY